MKINGVATLHAPPEQVWAALNNPAVLVVAIPGCERLEATGPNSYRLTVTAGVASIQGTYAGDISLSEQREPNSFVLTANGAGAPGTVSTSVQVRLAATGDGTTEVNYDADAVIGGMIAGVGQRMLSSVAKRMAMEFFAAVDSVLSGAALTGTPTVAAVPATLGEPSQPGGTTQPATQAAYVAPARPTPPNGAFVRGVLVGAGVALAGVAVGSLLGRKAS
jgi:uncharacterized protein